jgi:hypothetical protein
MSYIGKSPAVGNFVKLDAISTSSTNSYSLTLDSVAFVPESANHMLVSLNGVIQAPLTAFSVSGSTITFLPSSGTLSSSDSIDFIMVYGNVLDIGTPSDSTVTNAKTNFVSTSSAAGLQIKGDGTTDGTLQLNCSQNSHGIKLKSPAHSASQSYTLTFPTTSPSADKFLQTDGSGNLSFADAGGITEADQWRLSADTNQNSNADVTSNWERNDSSGWSKIGTGLSESSGIFSFASTGIYLITFIATFTVDDGDGNVEFILKITTDNSSYNEVSQCRSGNSGSTNISSTGISHFLFDVQDTSNYKFKFTTGSFASASKLQGATGSQQTGFTAIRLGNT